MTGGTSVEAPRTGAVAERRPLIFLVCGVLSLPVVDRICGFVIRSTYRQQIIFNEGWNAYHAHAAAAGEALYGSRPDRIAVNYPPLSFHLAGALGRVLGDVNLAGRLISLVALVWIALCAALIVREISKDNVAGAFAALFCLGWFSFFAPTYVGANDPQLAGHALILTAVFLYLIGQQSAPILAGACILCCAGGFIKPNLLAFPVAISLHLLWRSRRYFALWMVAVSITLALFTMLTFRVDGAHFFEHLLSPRGYSFARAAGVSASFFSLFVPVLAVCGVWSMRSFRHPPARLLILAFAISLVCGVYFCGGSGVSLNVFFDSLIAMAMIAALALTELAELAGSGTMKALAVMAAVPVILSSGLLMAGRHSAVPSRQELAEADRTFMDGVAYLKSKPGPALCLNLLLCYEAGKPLIYDPFSTAERMATGRLDARWIAADLTGRRFSVIQMVDEEFTGFPRELVAALNSGYQMERRTSAGVFYVPKEVRYRDSR